MKNIVIFASGTGSNFQAIVDAVEDEKIKASVCGLLVNNAKAYAVKRAKKHGIPHTVLNPRDFTDKEQYAQIMLQQLVQWKPDLIVLAGYLLKVPEKVVNTYAGNIINIHPSLLPKYSGKGFYGINVHQAVLESGDDETGCTVHVVDNIYDNGPIISQVRVPVHKSDKAGDISERVRKKELEILPKIVASIINTSD
ncbi:MAG: phosphoribosylglycinamide formyltransferase [Balneolales bacterium]